MEITIFPKNKWSNFPLENDNKASFGDSTIGSPGWLKDVFKTIGMPVTFSTFKSKLSESIIEKICPIGDKIKNLLKDKSYLVKILTDGSKKADLIAKNNLKEIYDIMGLTKFSWYSDSYYDGRNWKYPEPRYIEIFTR